MNKVDTFIKKARIHLQKQKLLNQNGRVLYSAAKTFKKGKFYILGMNPGGDAKAGKFRGETISFSLKNLPQQNNNYIDESWGGGDWQKGENPLQIRIRWLFEDGLSQNLADICASNLIFLQSKGASSLDFPSDADKCWPVHEEIIKMADPKVLLVFGNSGISPFAYLKKLAQQNESLSKEDDAASGHGDWVCRSFDMNLLGQKRTIIGLPHLSRYKVDGKKQSRIVGWIKKKIK